MRKVETRFGSGAYEQRITVGSHHLLSDVDASKGGSDNSPSPHEYLAAALAACTGMTLKMYASRKSWGLENAIVTVDINRVEDVERFTRQIRLVGSSLDAEQKERLMDIADKCPVHKALIGTIAVETLLVD
ncbi:MAG: OsmC family protein [Polynucleobacter sp.]|nr:OsmC family protein [Polynucleobacter sp.]